MGEKVLGKGTVSEQKHNGPLHCLDVSQDGDIVVTGGDDCNMNVWKSVE